MPRARDTGRTRATRSSASSSVIELPDLPPKSPAEVAADQKFIAMARRLAAELRQTNLDNAVLLAKQAAAGRGPLVDHFAELGRRYSELLTAPPRPRLRVIEGGGR